jgi:hypothetical protein
MNRPHTKSLKKLIAMMIQSLRSQDSLTSLTEEEMATVREEEEGEEGNVLIKGPDRKETELFNI